MSHISAAKAPSVRPVQTFDAGRVGTRIQEARRLAGLTQQEFADLLDVSMRSVQNYESGVSIPYRHLKAISGLVNRPVEWFLYGDAYAVSQLDEALRDRGVEALGDLVEQLKAVVPLLKGLVHELQLDRVARRP